MLLPQGWMWSEQSAGPLWKRHNIRDLRYISVTMEAHQKKDMKNYALYQLNCLVSLLTMAMGVCG